MSDAVGSYFASRRRERAGAGRARVSADLAAAIIPAFDVVSDMFR